MTMMTNRLSELVGKAIPVFEDQIGFVRLIDVMGDDQRIVDAARVSYGPGTKTVRDDEKLICYLMNNGHTSPFEQVVFTFQLKLPIFVMRQLVRHRTARLNEVSARYSEMKEEFYIPEELRIKGQDSKNKQGSAGELTAERRADARQTIQHSSANAYDDYQYLLRQGMARELARIILPVNLYTEVYWQMDLNNLFKFLTQRTDHHAQWEIRQYAYVMESIIQAATPLAFKAYVECTREPGDERDEHAR